MLNYNTTGQGPCAIFLHGYLESGEIWNGVKEKLKDNYKIIIPDLPGHGKSKVYSEVHSMEFMAEKVLEILNKENVEKCTMFGHSMGGYTALAFAGLFPERLNKLVLVHSHPFADSTEKIKDREREIELILAEKKHLLLSTSIPRLYANSNLESMKEKISISMKIAESMSDKAIIAAINGMKTRTDKTDIFKTKSFSKHLILGKEDNLISYREMMNFAIENEIPYDLLEKSGHMGFFEEKERFEGLVDLLIC